MNQAERNKFVNALYLMYSNDQVDAYNNQKLKHLTVSKKERVCRLNGEHNCSTARALTSDLMNGLPSFIIIARGARVMITANVWKSKGLVNGATGTVRHIIFKIGACPPDLPLAVIVEMDVGYTGPCLIGKPLHVAVNMKTAMTTSETGSHLERTMAPLRLSFAVTIHKCQGMTLDKALVDLGHSERTVGVSFVGLSRIRRIEDLLIANNGFDANRLCNIKRPQYVTEFDETTKRLVAATKEKFKDL